MSVCQRVNVQKKSQSTLQAVQEHLRREGHDVDTLILEIEARQLQGCENLGVLGGQRPMKMAFASQNPWGRCAAFFVPEESRT